MKRQDVDPLDVAIVRDLTWDIAAAVRCEDWATVAKFARDLARVADDMTERD